MPETGVRTDSTPVYTVVEREAIQNLPAAAHRVFLKLCDSKKHNEMSVPFKINSALYPRIRQIAYDTEQCSSSKGEEISALSQYYRYRTAHSLSFLNGWHS